MADIVVALSVPDPETGVQLKERYRDMGDGTHARVVSNAAGGGGGSGDVVGPASATADALALFNGTTGKLVKDGGTLAAALAALGVYPPVTVTLSVADILCASAVNGGGLYAVAVASGGTAYVVGDIAAVDSGTGTVIVTAETGGVVTAIRVATAGDNHSVENGVTTTFVGPGAGLTVNITAIAGLPVLVTAPGAGKMLWPNGPVNVSVQGIAPLTMGDKLSIAYDGNPSYLINVGAALVPELVRDQSDPTRSFVYGSGLMQFQAATLDSNENFDPRNKPWKLYTATGFVDDGVVASDVSMTITIPYTVTTTS